MTVLLALCAFCLTNRLYGMMGSDQEFVCPVDKTRFTAWQAVSGTAIGMRLGFAAPAHFSRFFRDHVSVPPSIFRGIVRRGGQPAA